MSNFICQHCGKCFDTVKVKKIYNKKIYCLNCYTMFYQKDKCISRRRTKKPKLIFTVRLNKDDFNKIDVSNKSEFVRKCLEYIVNHPRLMDKIIGE